MRKTTFLYGITDDKYVSAKDEKRSTTIGSKNSVSDTFKHAPSHIFKNPKNFDRESASIVAKCSPDTLMNMAALVVNAIPLPSVFTWTIEDICRWLRNYGYPQYQNTFRENLVNGHTFLLLDAAALSAINIKDFDHIKHIAYGIRSLYFYEITKFGRSISLAPEFHLELYKNFRVKTGRTFETTKRTDQWRQMQLIREQRQYFDHWSALEYNLKMERYPKYPEIFGRRRNQSLQKCKPVKEIEKSADICGICKCVPPCQCYWNVQELRENLRVSTSTYLGKSGNLQNSRLALLEELYPFKYGPYLHEIIENNIGQEVIHFN